MQRPTSDDHTRDVVERRGAKEGKQRSKKLSLVVVEVPIPTLDQGAGLEGRVLGRDPGWPSRGGGCRVPSGGGRGACVGAVSGAKTR